MKPSLRSVSALILLAAAITILTSRSLLRPRSLESPPVPATAVNDNLLRLASLSAAEPLQREDVSHLLASTLTASNGRDHVFLTLSIPADSSGRRFHRFRTRAPNRHIHHILQHFHLSLRDRLANRSTASDHLRLIKRRVDLHYGYPDTGRPYASCAVVGNSGVLLSSDNGDLIDGHDLVIRLNNARTAGYERHVGFKTSVSFINSNVLRLCVRREGCACHPYGGFVPIVIYLCQPAHFLDYLACNYSHAAPLLVTDPRLDALSLRIVKYYSMKRFVEETGRRPEEWGEVHDDMVFHYSSGMEAVVLGLGICQQVSLFGFGKLEGVKHHYHTNQKEELKLHDYEAEYAFYHDLVERPEVIPFLEDSGFKIPNVFLYQ